jgi:riboflavin transporter FmnP
MHTCSDPIINYIPLLPLFKEVYNLLKSAYNSLAALVISSILKYESIALKYTLLSVQTSNNKSGIFC